MARASVSTLRVDGKRALTSAMARHAAPCCGSSRRVLRLVTSGHTGRSARVPPPQRRHERLAKVQTGVSRAGALTPHSPSSAEKRHESNRCRLTDATPRVVPQTHAFRRQRKPGINGAGNTYPFGYKPSPPPRRPQWL